MFRTEVKEALAVDLFTSLHTPSHILNMHVLLLKLVNCWSMAPCELKKMQHKLLMQSKCINSTFIKVHLTNTLVNRAVVAK